MKLHMIRLSTKGQSLLEVTIAIGVATLVLSALAITTLIGLKNTQFSQNQLQATKLAQEGIEFIKAMKDRDRPIYNNVTLKNYYWDTNVTGNEYVWNGNLPTASTTYYLLTSAPDDGSAQMTDQSPPAGTGELALNDKFNRKVTISAPSANELQFTVTVNWKDSSGNHKSQLITILANYQ